MDADIDKIIPFLFNSKCGNSLLEKISRRIYLQMIYLIRSKYPKYMKNSKTTKKSDKKWAEDLNTQFSNEYI